MPRTVKGRLADFEWSRTIRELVVVIVGVFAAIALYEWVSGRRDRAEEELFLRAVRTEFQSVIADMDHEIVFRKAMTANTERFFEMASGGTRPDARTMDEMLGKLMWWSSAELTTGATQSILVSGKLRLIENEEIRYFLAGLPDRLASIKQTESNDYYTLREATVPYLQGHADVSQILTTMGERPGTPSESGTTWMQAYKPKSPRNHVPLLDDTEFAGVVGGVEASQLNVIWAYESLRPDLAKMIGLIDEELAD